MSVFGDGLQALEGATGAKLFYAAVDLGPTSTAHTSKPLKGQALCRVEITVFDTNGKRHILRGKEGDTLVELLAMNEDALGGTGEGPLPL